MVFHYIFQGEFHSIADYHESFVVLSFVHNADIYCYLCSSYPPTSAAGFLVIGVKGSLLLSNNMWAFERSVLCDLYLHISGSIVKASI
jgi:hypothetical protein